MTFLTKIFPQRTATLYNGEKVKLGDKVSFINSDGLKCTGTIQRRADGTLFFWNISFQISEYRSAYKEPYSN